MPRKSEDLQWLIDMLIPMMNGTRQRRLFIESEWLLNYRAWQGWPSQSYILPLPDNAIHYFIPHVRRAVERNVARATKLLMPNQDWHQTLPFDGKSHENAESVHNVMRYVYTKKYPTKRLINTGIRCLELYNFTATHTSVAIQNDEVWPYQRVVDPFNFYVFPDTANNTEDALLIFEDSIVPYQVYNGFVDKDNPELSLYEPLKADELAKPVWPYHLVERLGYRGLTNPSDFIEGSGSTLTITESQRKEIFKQTNEELANQANAFVALSKVYFRLSSRWYYTVICTNIKGGATDNISNKYNAKVVRLDDTENQPLYRWTNTRPLPGELYTNARVDDIRVLQNLANTTLSQVESNRTMFAEPPIVMDAAAQGRTESKVFGNRKVWTVDTGGAKVSDIIQSLDIEDTSTNGIRDFQIYLGLIDKGSGGGLAEGTPGRNMPRAGFAANTLLNVALIDVEDLADTYEQDVLTPGLADTYHIILEYIPDSQLIKIPNKNPNLIKAYAKNDITGDYSFTWLGSLGFQDTQVRADKFMQFLQTLLNPAALQLVLQQLSQQKQTIDFVNLIKTVYSFGLGERGLGDIIIPLTPEQLQAMNQPSPEQQRSQAELQMKQQELQSKQQIELAKVQGDLQGKQLDMQIAQQKGGIEIQKGKLDLQGKALDIHAKQVDTVNKALQPLQGSKNGQV